ncbi:hypothetical protein L7F22_054867 [Adiantum nelumboides]|nr:hypothetical protein [Adiantum nelumboides]
MLFNRALAKGLPAEWTMHTIVPIHKSGDPLDPSNYRTIMIGHTLAKLYGAVLEAELSSYVEREGLRAPVPRDRLFQRLLTLGVPSEMLWGIFSLYERVSARVRCPGGTSSSLASTIGVKQGCPLSPTLFGLYIDELSEHILRDGGGGVDLADTPVHIMLYADDIVLVSESHEGLQRHLWILDDFCTRRGLTVILGKTKVLIFHASRQVRSRATFTLAGGRVEVTDSYVYLGTTFTATTRRFSMASAARDRITRGYATLAMLERRCHQAHFQEPRTKGCLFDTLVTPALMYAAPVWAPSLTGSWWTQVERPQIIMLSRLIRGKPSVPHDIIRAELATPPMLETGL